MVDIRHCGCKGILDDGAVRMPTACGLGCARAAHIGAYVMSKYEGQGPERPLSPEFDDDDAEPGSGLRKRRNDNLAPMRATLDDLFGEDWDLPPIEDAGGDAK